MGKVILRSPSWIAACTLLAAFSVAVMQGNDAPHYRNKYAGADAAVITDGLQDAAAEIQSTHPPVRGVIVPHHLVAAKSYALGIRSLQGQGTERILLLSPDHFGKCDTALCTTDGSFGTLSGALVRTDAAGVRQVLTSPQASLNRALFDNEHGVFSVIPFIASLLPDATVVPVALSVNTFWKSDRNELLTTLEPLLDERTAIVVSSDFSHYLRLAEANEQDEATAKVLFSKDLPGLLKLKNPQQSDCPGCLWMLGSLADRGNFYLPSVLAHTNSATLLNAPTVAETTSHFAMAFYENATLSPDDAAFGGDVTFTRNTRTPKISSVLASFWAGKGLRIVNLEGPLLDTCEPHENIFIFCNKHSLFTGLASLATHWSVLNNHMYDQGLAGFDETLRILAADKETALSWEPVEADGVRLFAGTELLNPVPDRADLRGAKERTLAALRSADRQKLNVVYVHTGTEYESLMSEDWKAGLRRYIDAGADAVIGMHTHVVSDVEFYKGKPIFHGIGNFIFDQKDAVATSTAMLVRLRKDGGNVRVQTFIAQ